MSDNEPVPDFVRETLPQSLYAWVQREFNAKYVDSIYEELFEVMCGHVVGSRFAQEAVNRVIEAHTERAPSYRDLRIRELTLAIAYVLELLENSGQSLESALEIAGEHHGFSPAVVRRAYEGPDTPAQLLGGTHG